MPGAKNLIDAVNQEAESSGLSPPAARAVWPAAGHRLITEMVYTAGLWIRFGTPPSMA